MRIGRRRAGVLSRTAAFTEAHSSLRSGPWRVMVSRWAQLSKVSSSTPQRRPQKAQESQIAAGPHGQCRYVTAAPTKRDASAAQRPAVSGLTTPPPWSTSDRHQPRAATGLRTPVLIDRPAQAGRNWPSSAALPGLIPRTGLDRGATEQLRSIRQLTVVRGASRPNRPRAGLDGGATQQLRSKQIAGHTSGEAGDQVRPAMTSSPVSPRTRCQYLAVVRGASRPNRPVLGVGRGATQQLRSK
jgi:hypothetical protein